jgi:hypothetical protein
MVIEILFNVLLIVASIPIAWMIVSIVCYHRDMIKKRGTFYRDYDLRPRVLSKLQRKLSSCCKENEICTSCPYYDDCAMCAIREAMNEIDEELKNDD